MNFPIKCFTCNKLIGHLKPKFDEKVKEYSVQDNSDIKTPEFKAFEHIGIPLNKYCCRSIFMTSVKINFS